MARICKFFEIIRKFIQTVTTLEQLKCQLEQIIGIKNTTGSCSKRLL